MLKDAADVVRASKPGNVASIEPAAVSLSTVIVFPERAIILNLRPEGPIAERPVPTIKPFAGAPPAKLRVIDGVPPPV